jgi:hypothetical protein
MLWKKNIKKFGGAALTQRYSDGLRKYTKSKDPGFAPLLGQPFKKIFK